MVQTGSTLMTETVTIACLPVARPVSRPRCRKPATVVPGLLKQMIGKLNGKQAPSFSSLWPYW